MQIDKELKNYLHSAFHGKCGYCETKIVISERGNVDRYRPNNGVRDKKNYYQDLYWWVTFEWDNLIYSCKECNQYKANYFPIKGTRAKDEKDDLKNEQRMLLNPYEDEPNQHSSYDNEGNIIPLTDKGNQTISLLRLDRTDLINRRQKSKTEVIEAVESIISGKSESKFAINYLKKIYELEDLEIEFLSYKRWVLSNELDTTPFLGQMLNLEDYKQDENWIDKIGNPKLNFNKKDLIKSDYFPIEYVYIKNFKSIDELRIDFNDDELDKKSWLFLLGENGVGKSSILQAIAIGLKVDKKLVEPLIPVLVKKRKQTEKR